MNLQEYIVRLETMLPSLTALLSGISEDQAHWKPARDEWSIVEVINHLYDEEREDFRLRLTMTLTHPEQLLPPIDPEGWAVQREYNQREFRESLERFLEERRQSLVWLRTLETPDWTLPINHPRLTGLRAGDMLAAWAGHDLLHLRQIIELRWKYLQGRAKPYILDYAGEW